MRSACVTVTPTVSNETSALSGSMAGGHLQCGRAMRMFVAVERTIGALVELQFRPKRRPLPAPFGEPEILGIEAEIQRLLRSVRQIEAVPDALRLAHATSR